MMFLDLCGGRMALTVVPCESWARIFVLLLQLQLLPRRWVVERTLVWLNRNHRLAKDFEQTIASAAAWLVIASVQFLARRITRP